jgi:hypothetical protein
MCSPLNAEVITQLTAIFASLVLKLAAAIGSRGSLVQQRVKSGCVANAKLPAKAASPINLANPYSRKTQLN